MNNDAAAPAATARPAGAPSEAPETAPAPTSELASSLPDGRVELGLHTFGDVTEGPDGTLVGQPQVLRDVVAEGVLADQVGVDVFGVGEHHRPDYAVSAPDMVLAAIGAQTEGIKLISAVTVLSSDDPVRVHQSFATLDGLTSGRAEVSLGRGSFIESFPLFGHDLKDYERLYEEKLDLFMRLRAEEPVTWRGTVRAPLERQSVFPTTDHAGGLPTWVAVGGSPESVVRAASHGAGLELAIIGGAPARFAPYADLFRREVAERGLEPRRVAVHVHGFVADTDEEAAEAYYPHWERAFAKLARERGGAMPTPEQFRREVLHGAQHIGSPESVARKVAATIRALGASRLAVKYSNATLPHAAMMKSIELYGTKVAPLVREMLAEG